MSMRGVNHGCIGGNSLLYPKFPLAKIYIEFFIVLRHHRAILGYASTDVNR